MKIILSCSKAKLGSIFSILHSETMSSEITVQKQPKAFDRGQETPWLHLLPEHLPTSCVDQVIFLIFCALSLGIHSMTLLNICLFILQHYPILQCGFVCLHTVTQCIFSLLLISLWTCISALPSVPHSCFLPISVTTHTLFGVRLGAFQP